MKLIFDICTYPKGVDLERSISNFLNAPGVSDDVERALATELEAIMGWRDIKIIASVCENEETRQIQQLKQSNTCNYEKRLIAEIRVRVLSGILDEILAVLGNLIGPLRDGASIFDEAIASPLSALIRLMEKARSDSIDAVVNDYIAAELTVE